MGAGLLWLLWVAPADPVPPAITPPPVESAPEPSSSAAPALEGDLAVKWTRAVTLLEEIAERLDALAGARRVPLEAPSEASSPSTSSAPAGATPERRVAPSSPASPPVPAPPAARMALVETIPRKFETDDEGTYEVASGYGPLIRDRHFLWTPRDVVERYGIPDEVRSDDRGQTYFIYEEGLGDFREVTLTFGRQGLTRASASVR